MVMHAHAPQPCDTVHSKRARSHASMGLGVLLGLAGAVIGLEGMQHTGCKPAYTSRRITQRGTEAPRRSTATPHACAANADADAKPSTSSRYAWCTTA